MTEITTIRNQFDYGQFDTETRITIRQRAERVQERNRSIALNIWENGRDLHEAQQELAKNGYGCFVEWAESETGLSKQMVYNFINVYTRFDCQNFGQSKIAASALYLLAAPSTPEPARVEAIQRAEAGEPITHTTAKTIVAQHKPQPTAAHVEATKREYQATITPAPAIAAPPPIGRVEPVAVQPEPEPEPEGEERDGDENYTPPYIIEAARKVLGAIDLDPASCVRAQSVVKAEAFFTKQDNGLISPWYGRVWLNPPFSGPAPFTNKLIEEYEAGRVSAAVLLVNNGTETQWGQALLSRYPVCFVGAHGGGKSRIDFWQTDPEEKRTGNRYAQMIFFLGDYSQTFAEVFSQFGVIKT